VSLQPAPVAIAANPRHQHHPGYRTGLAVVIAILAVLFVGSIVGTLVNSPIAMINLVGLLVVGFFAAGTYILVLAFSLRDAQRRHRRIRIASIVLGVALLLWLFIVASVIAGLNLVGAIVSIPTTGFAIWLLRHVNRNQKEPWRLLLAAFGWGGVVAVNMAILLEGPFDRFFTRVLIPGPGQGLSASFSAALFEEVPKGLAVVLLYLVMRNQFDDVVDGIVYGALVGLGFNFVEGLGYMAAHGLVGQFYVRQLLGLFTGHTTYTALIGAGLGVARQQSVAWKRVLAILSGFTTAVAAHFLWDALVMTSFLPHSSSAALEVFVFLPLKVAFIDGPFTVLVLMLLYLGLRREGQIIQEQLTAEAALGLGTVLPEEVPILSSPRLRARLRRKQLLTYGWRGYRWLGRLQRAQLDLAWERWHRARQDIDDPLQAEDQLRQRILIVRAGGR
jgi:RsiW-degrading membrane proteinase PrsW (M82 family)